MRRLRRRTHQVLARQINDLLSARPFTLSRQRPSRPRRDQKIFSASVGSQSIRYRQFRSCSFRLPLIHPEAFVRLSWKNETWFEAQAKEAAGPFSKVFGWDYRTTDEIPNSRQFRPLPQVGGLFDEAIVARYRKDN